MLLKTDQNIKSFAWREEFKSRVSSGLYFPVFEMNKAIYNSCSWTRKNFVLGTFSRSVESGKLQAVLKSSEEYSEPCHISTMELFVFAKIGNILS